MDMRSMDPRAVDQRAMVKRTGAGAETILREICLARLEGLKNSV
jgi:hypothetical protein